MSEQRNRYKGSPPRPWFRLVLVAADGTTREIEALADTGNPCALIVSTQTIGECNVGLAPGMSTNFGRLVGGWLRVRVPELSFDETILAYGSDEVVEATQASDGDLQALAGLPLLRLLEYGGDCDSFWLGTPS